MGFQTMAPPPAENFAARIFLGPALRAQPDRRLVDLVRDGYDAAFEEIVRRYRRPLDRFAAAIVGGRSEDVTQDAFSKALLALRGSEAEIELRPWLYRIVRNTALNDLRDSAQPTEELHEDLAGARSAAAAAEEREELAELMERVRALPEPQRAALVMRELEGLSHEEIAAALGVSGGAARQAIYRARSTLRDGLGLLVPLPLLRVLAEHGGEAAAAGGAMAGAGGASAGGAFLGGLGGGTAAKVGVATVLVAGAAGAGVAVENRGGNDDRGAEAAQAAPLAPGSGQGNSPQATGSSGSGSGSQGSRSGKREDGSSGRGGGGEDGRREEARADAREDRRDDRADRREDRADRREDRVDDREDRADDDRRGSSSGSSGSGSSGSGSSGSSGSGSSGSGSSGSSDDFEVDDNSGSGSSGSDDVAEIEPPGEPEIEEPEVEVPEPDDSSGSGSGEDFDEDFDED
ncbi:MAG TPA: RNA polymerase sigma factor [Solirubrobacterales bacterium]|nr:RNA polymerase sigma factor [Solirubrobacterales bacterium]